MEKNEISRALEDLANEIERAPIELVGVKVSVESGQGAMQLVWKLPSRPARREAPRPA